jgi:DNA-binding LacI/PurR family transcriptional regulator
MAVRERVTIRDVARCANVSPTTVSHVLSGRRAVAPTTKERVYRAVRDLGYRPHATARSLRTSRTQLAALAVPDITNPFYPSMMRGMADELAGHGYRVMVHNTDGEREQELEVLDTLTDGSVDGAVLFAFHLTDRDLRPVSDSGVPLVVLGMAERASGVVDMVTSDDRSGMDQATRHVLGLGRHPLGFLGGPADAPMTKSRLDGFRAAHHSMSRRVEPRLITAADFTTAGGAEAARRLLGEAGAPRGIVCANDLMAIGALQAATELGFRVPDDVAIVGFDDIEAASLVRPRLTTVSNRAREHGQVCARLLLDRLAGEYSGAGRTVMIPTDLVLRESA